MTENLIAIEKLKLLLTDDEINDLVEALETVFTYRNGYGMVQIEIERRRIKQVSIINTFKPGKTIS